MIAGRFTLLQVRRRTLPTADAREERSHSSRFSENVEGRVFEYVQRTGIAVAGGHW